MGRGGQGTTYAALEATYQDSLHDNIAKAVRQLSGSGSKETYHDAIKQLSSSLADYLAIDHGKNVVALKVIHDQLKTDRKALQRLKQEVDALVRVDDPHIVKIIEAFPDDGWFVTTYFPQGNLADNLEQFRGETLNSLEAFRSLVNAVALLHNRQLIHRDIKPANIFLSEKGPVLGDFGLVFFSDQSDKRISDTYENVGSRDWMPPFAYGKRVDELRPSFDVFSLGKVLWAMISGKTVLPLWWHRKPEYDLTRLLPENPHAHLINAVLDSCLVEDERRIGYPSAMELLDQVDRIIMIVRRGGELLRKDILRPCRVCGYGTYEPLIDEARHPGTSRDIGLNPVGLIRWRMYCCDKCGNVQMFQLVQRPEAWGENF